jgi:hypothetical protein
MTIIRELGEPVAAVCRNRWRGTDDVAARLF